MSSLSLFLALWYEWYDLPMFGWNAEWPTFRSVLGGVALAAPRGIHGRLYGGQRAGKCGRRKWWSAFRQLEHSGGRIKNPPQPCALEDTAFARILCVAALESAQAEASGERRAQKPSGGGHGHRSCIDTQGRLSDRKSTRLNSSHLR